MLTCLYLLYIFGYWFADALRLPRVLRRGDASLVPAWRASLFIDSVDDPWWSLPIMPPQTDCSVFTLHQLQCEATRAPVPDQQYQHSENRGQTQEDLVYFRNKSVRCSEHWAG